MRALSLSYRYLSGDDPQYDPTPFVGAFNLVMTAYASRTAAQFGKNRYYYPAADFPGEVERRLSLGLDAWKGFYSSVRPVYKVS